jgi:hypothetical protein
MASTEQKMFIVEAEIDLGNPFETIELTRSYPLRDAAGVFRPNYLADVLRSAGDALEELINDGQFSEEQVMKITVREMQEDEQRGETV